MDHEIVQEGGIYYTAKDLESEQNIPINSEVIVEKKSRNGDVNIQVKVTSTGFKFWMNSENLIEANYPQNIQPIDQKKNF